MSKGRCTEFKAVVRRETKFGDVGVYVHVPGLCKHVFSNLGRISLVDLKSERVPVFYKRNGCWKTLESHYVKENTSSGCRLGSCNCQDATHHLRLLRCVRRGAEAQDNEKHPFAHHFDFDTDSDWAFLGFSYPDWHIVSIDEWQLLGDFAF